MELFLYSLFFAIICLDKKHTFQFAISQPLITCSIIGFFFNAYLPAMYFGLLIQLLWLGNLPFGASKTPEGNIASVIGCWLYVEYCNLYADYGQLILLVLFIYIVVISYIASKAETVLRHINIRLFDRAYESVHENQLPNLGKFILGALGIQVLANCLIIVLGLFSGRFLLNHLTHYVPADLSEIWQFVETAIWAAGIGLVISVYKNLKFKRAIVGLALITLLTIEII